VPLLEAFWYHAVHQGDAAHLWLREILAESSRSLPEHRTIANDQKQTTESLGAEESDCR
jgi:hypothetical protein